MWGTIGERGRLCGAEGAVRGSGGLYRAEGAVWASWGELCGAVEGLGIGLRRLWGGAGCWAVGG